MNLNEIIASINNWNAISHDSDALLDVLAQGDCFHYRFENNGTEQESIHAYPGIHNNELKFFMIPAEYDTEQYESELDKYITVCTVVPSPPTSSHRILEAEAKARMDRWKDDYKTWVPKQAATSDGIFLAFNINTEDFEVADTVLNLALKLDNNPTKMKADMIVTNKTVSEVFYDDYTEPVPPYTATASSTSFYLLSM